MPRRSRKQKESEVQAAAVGEERTAVFSKTKMCKFFILGQCSKGRDCCFAHDNCELQHTPNLQRTKLCKTLINTGNCHDPECTYAHNRDELRVVDGFNTSLHINMVAARNSNPLEKAIYPVSRPDGRPSRTEMKRINATAFPAPSNTFMPAHGGQGQAAGIRAPPSPCSGGHVVDQGMNSAMQAARLQQMGNDLLAQATMIQMGQAAQAHAAEAMRLQAMATYLQANMVPMSGTMAMAPASSTASPNQPGGYPVAAGQQHQLPGFADAGQRHGQAIMSETANNQPAETASAGAGVGGFTKANAGSLGGRETCGRNKNRPEGRSFDSSREEAGKAVGFRPHDRSDEVGGGDVAGGGLVVKNTFLSTNSSGDLAATEARLRPVRTCGASLQSYAGEPVEGDLDRSPMQSLDFPRNAGLGKNLSKTSLCTLDPLPEEAAAELAAGPAPRSFESHGFRAHDTTPLFPGLNTADKVHVKNTFIEFDSNERPKGSLRVVHTCSGRLDQMANPYGLNED